MKQLGIAYVLACILIAGICHAGDINSATPAAGEKIVQVDRNGDGKIDGEDIYDREGRLVRKGYDMNGDGVMERYDTYDPNTGMPNVVESDANDELI